MSTNETQAKQQSLQIAVPDPHCTGCDQATVFIEIPYYWSLSSSKQKEQPTLGESFFNFATGPDCHAHVILQARSLGDELENSPKELFHAAKGAMQRRYWVRSFEGVFAPEGGQFVRELTVFPLYRAKACITPRPRQPLGKLLAKLRRERPQQVWMTECFKFFRFQVLIISIAPYHHPADCKDALELLSTQLKQALARYAAGRMR